MKFSLIKAAKAAGVAKSTIHRDIKSGKLSATRLENGSFEIDASELFRVYPPKALDAAETGSRTPEWDGKKPPGTDPGAELLAAELKMLREVLARVDLDRDRERRQLSDTIDDLRARLDREGEERRALNQQLLAYQRPPEPPAPSGPPEQPPRRGFLSMFKKAG